MDREIGKWMTATSIQMMSDPKNKFRINSNEEQEFFYKKNIDFHFLYLTQIPFECFLIDDNGHKSSFPFNYLDDNKFSIPSESRLTELISYGVNFWVLKDLIREEIFILGRLVIRLNLSKEEIHQFCFAVFCDILTIRLKLWRKVKHSILLPLQETNLEYSLNMYQCYLNFGTMPKSELDDIKNQIVYFNEMVTYEIWEDLMWSISEILKERYFKLITAYSIVISTGEIDKHYFLCDIYQKFKLDILLRDQTNKNTHREYDEYSLKVFEETKKYLAEKQQISLNVTNKSPTMIENQFNNYGQAGAVGPNASSTNSTFHQTNYPVPADINYERLSDELLRLKQALTSVATSSEDFVSLSEVVKAQEASQQKQGDSVAKHLIKAGLWVSRKAEEIGVAVVSELITKGMGGS